MQNLHYFQILTRAVNARAKPISPACSCHMTATLQRFSRCGFRHGAHHRWPIGSLILCNIPNLVHSADSVSFDLACTIYDQPGFQDRAATPTMQPFNPNLFTLFQSLERRARLMCLFRQHCWSCWSSQHAIGYIVMHARLYHTCSRILQIGLHASVLLIHCCQVSG